MPENKWEQSTIFTYYHLLNLHQAIPRDCG